MTVRKTSILHRYNTSISIGKFAFDELPHFSVYNTAIGKQEQYTDYYPYGMPHVQMQKSSTVTPVFPGFGSGLGSGLGSGIILPGNPTDQKKTTNRRLYSAKELTTDHGLNAYDFAARWLSPALPRFSTPDPLAEKYLHNSAYTYCNSDPINLIDPTGMDIYRINRFGFVLSHEENEECDQVIMVDKKNNPIEDKTLEFEAGTIKYFQSNGADNSGSVYSYLTVSDESAAKSLFEFITDATNVEWTNARLSDRDEENYSLISTSHERYSERAFVQYLNEWTKPNKSNSQIKDLKYHIHNHPSNIPIPSGLGGEGGDIGLAKELDSYFNKTIPYYVYSSRFNTYIKYSSHSTSGNFAILYTTYLMLNKFCNQ